MLRPGGLVAHYHRYLFTVSGSVSDLASTLQFLVYWSLYKYPIQRTCAEPGLSFYRRDTFLSLLCPCFSFEGSNLSIDREFERETIEVVT